MCGYVGTKRWRVLSTHGNEEVGGFGTRVKGARPMGRLPPSYHSILITLMFC